MSLVVLLIMTADAIVADDSAGVAAGNAAVDAVGCGSWLAGPLITVGDAGDVATDRCRWGLLF